MCTVSWRPLEGGYELFFNRDERRSRAPARPPCPIEHHDAELLTPADGDFGGSWIASNRHGLTVALLNRYQDAEHEGPGPFTSRGLLVLDLATAASVADLAKRMAAADLAPYRAFTLLAVEPAPGAAGESRAVHWRPNLWRPNLWQWDARRLAGPEAATSPLASSGYAPLTIQEERRALYRELVPEPVTSEALLAYQTSHRPERGAFSPCMHRPDAATVSLTHVRVDAQQVAMAYAPGPPCRTPLGEPLILPRAPVTGAGFAGDGPTGN